MARGKFIVFEGIDGSGKSTTMTLLKSVFESKYANPFSIEEEPTYNPIGRIFHNVMTEDIPFDNEVAAGLVMMDRFDHIINPTHGLLTKLNAGETVFESRYTYSTLAYNMSDINRDYVVYLHKKYNQVLHPDLIIYLDIDPEIALKRIKRGRDHEEFFEKLDDLRRIRRNYLNVFSEFGENDNIYTYSITEDTNPFNVVEDLTPIIDEIITK